MISDASGTASRGGDETTLQQDVQNAFHWIGDTVGHHEVFASIFGAIIGVACVFIVLSILRDL